MNKDYQCKTCHYFEKHIDPSDVSKSQGQCKRYPPSVQLVQTAQGIGHSMARPIVESGDFCGEWEADITVLNG